MPQGHLQFLQVRLCYQHLLLVRVELVIAEAKVQTIQVQLVTHQSHEEATVALVALAED
jgi:hypothetical protein